MVIEYSGDVIQVINDCADNPDKGCKDEFAFVVPVEGSSRWVDTVAIPKDAPEKDLARAFIDYLLDPQVSADISNFTDYTTPNQKAIDLKLIDADMLSSPIVYPTEETSKHLYLINDVGDAAQLYNDAWGEVKVQLGQ